MIAVGVRLRRRASDDADQGESEDEGGKSTAPDNEATNLMQLAAKGHVLRADTLEHLVQTIRLQQKGRR